MQLDLNVVTADPTDNEVQHARGVVTGRGGKALPAPHGTKLERFPINQATRANSAAMAEAEPAPFKLTPAVKIQSSGCMRHQRVEVPYIDPDGEEGVSVLCITCDALAATPDYGSFPRFES